ncbi:SDR family NAD(P)-dependent oxidoreductase [Streptomyces sp. NBC_00096]|uniref:SDR family NAD(P)-dependent oxidoreductase n=1 Tax=Streptomyces sp. NBC_00096 TaxID=2975650 RepID=UPI0032539308
MSARTALVTGASSGIGLAFARELASAGYAVTAVARGEDRLRALVGELGPGHRHLVADLATPEGRELVAAELARRPVDLLVNNAGTAHHGPFTAAGPQEALTSLRLGTDAVVVLAHAFLSGARRGDALINVSSTLAHAPAPGLAVYSAGKAFVTSFSEALWYEQRPLGVHVMALCPGPTSTESEPAPEPQSRRGPGPGPESAPRSAPQSAPESRPVPDPAAESAPQSGPASRPASGPAPASESATGCAPAPAPAPRRHQDAPSVLVQSPRAVVRAALRALDRRSGPTIVPGRANSLFVLATRLLPRRTLLAMLSR